MRSPESPSHPSAPFLGRIALAAAVMTAQLGCERENPQVDSQVAGECAEVRAQLKACQAATHREEPRQPQNPNQSTTKQEAVNPVVAESVEVDPRLSTFKADFDADPALQSKISWAEIQTRLLANEGHYLALAQAMEQGGQLFGVDAQGRPLISDRGDEPIMKGMNYEKTRDRVKYKHTSNDENGTKIFDENQQPIPTGYEMFGYNGDYNKSDEITQYENHTGNHLVQSPGKKEWRSSWLESGKNPSWPRGVGSDPNFTDSFVDLDYPNLELDVRGVRRLLRVEKN